MYQYSLDTAHKKCIESPPPSSLQAALLNHSRGKWRLQSVSPNSPINLCRSGRGAGGKRCQWLNTTKWQSLWNNTIMQFIVIHLLAPCGPDSSPLLSSVVCVPLRCHLSAWPVGCWLIGWLLILNHHQATLLLLFPLFYFQTSQQPVCEVFLQFSYSLTSETM